ncbi:MAG: iron ABC transporter permease [Bacteroidales bacterium]|nr:iron ABC transporter permease [Bacteroidales bacterium]
MSMRVSTNVLILSLLLLMASLFMFSLIRGSVDIPLKSIINILSGNETEKNSWTNIIWQTRLPQAVTAMLCGAALAVCGLMLQTLFRNPLAGPSILGISDGANLGVALVMMGGAAVMGKLSMLNITGNLLIIGGAFIGASFVLAIIIWFSSKIKNAVMLLIIGMMVGYIASSVISILNYYASPDRVHAFVMWGMGDFSSVTLRQLPLFSALMLPALLFSVLLIKPLNALLLGEQYATNLGIKIKNLRIIILICTGLLTAVATAYCGPISFIGLAVPHVARLMIKTSNFKRLLPVTLLTGANIALLCNQLTILPGGNGILLPLNAITPLFGAPIILYVILSRRQQNYFE